MNILFGVLAAAIAVIMAIRMARSQGVAALPLLGWSLLLALAVALVYVGGALIAFKLVHNQSAQLVILFISIVAGIAVGVWLSKRIWTRLQQRAPRR